MISIPAKKTQSLLIVITFLIILLWPCPLSLINFKRSIDNLGRWNGSDNPKTAEDQILAEPLWSFRRSSELIPNFTSLGGKKNETSDRQIHGCKTLSSKLNLRVNYSEVISAPFHVSLFICTWKSWTAVRSLSRWCIKNIKAKFPLAFWKSRQLRLFPRVHSPSPFYLSFFLILTLIIFNTSWLTLNLTSQYLFFHLLRMLSYYSKGIGPQDSFFFLPSLVFIW